MITKRWMIKPFKTISFLCNIIRNQSMKCTLLHPWKVAHPPPGQSSPPKSHISAFSRCNLELCPGSSVYAFFLWQICAGTGKRILSTIWSQSSLSSFYHHWYLHCYWFVASFTISTVTTTTPPPQPPSAVVASTAIKIHTFAMAMDEWLCTFYWSFLTKQTNKKWKIPLRARTCQNLKVWQNGSTYVIQTHDYCVTGLL